MTPPPDITGLVEAWGALQPSCNMLAVAARIPIVPNWNFTVRLHRPRGRCSTERGSSPRPASSVHEVGEPEICGRQRFMTQRQQAISPDEAKAIAQDAWTLACRSSTSKSRSIRPRTSEGRQGPCANQPVRSLSGVSRRVEPDRGRLQRRYAVFAGEPGSVERTDGPFGAGHGEAVLGDADHRRVEQRAACSGFPHGRRQGRSLRGRWPDVEGHTA